MCVDGEVGEELGDVGGSDDGDRALLQQLGVEERRGWGGGEKGVGGGEVAGRRGWGGG